MNMIPFKGDFIDGRFVLPRAGSERAVSEDPGDLDRPVGEFTFDEAAVDDAVQAARRAFGPWSKRSTKERTGYLIRFRHILKARASEFARLISREMGKVLSESKAEIARVLAKLDSARREEADLIRSTVHPIERGVVGRLRFRPRGVVAILSPFNVPAYLASAQIIPALLHGNTVVYKPSELTPFVGQFIASAWKEAGLPKGVFNLVQGAGVVGQTLVSHSNVDVVIFTGSWAVGSKVQEQVSRHPHKLCALEMGGKNSAIVCRDADFSVALDETVSGAYLTTGQRCNATSRIIVEEPIANRFIDGFLRRVNSIAIGYSQDLNAWMGPLVSEKTLKRVEGYLTRARAEGFEVLREGGRFDCGRKGHYLKPSVHLRRHFPNEPLQDGTYTDDEVFGPDVAIYIVRNLDEAIALNNRSHYGLVASIFTKSKAKFERVLREAENGLIHWNAATTRSSGRLPFGGLKRSGNDRPVGFFSPYVCTIPTSSVERALL
ncbi:MAG: hypothetical protein A3G87_06795 [Omnitrophica bacterium RIFCSPLOWO2_12_FULL_50_11]|nr:MAG: hypothetical protein A3G87_06795 [Omnitrophica bacterium RIFCSPLOWO2_12_FULL_50_11]